MNLQGSAPNTPSPDLIWEMGQQQDRELTERFLLSLSNRLCIHACSSARLHADYSLHLSANAAQVIVQPNAANLLETFHHVTPAALRRTGLYLLPGQEGPLLARLDAEGQTVDVHPLKKAMALILARFKQRGEPFLPVLIKGDLEVCRGTPRLHLHRLQINELALLSPFERRSIQRAVSDRLLALCRDADSRYR